jgi:pyridoxal phosphate enzyme (YggS family)
MLTDRLRLVQSRLARAAEAAGRDPSEVTLVAVSKFQPLEALRAAYALGVRDFGEARVDELREKRAAMPDDVRWHFVGALQKNKLREVREVAHLVHSFDRPELAEAWTRDATRAPPPVLLQVNVGEEPQKRGVAPAGAPAAVARLVDAGVSVRGLMCLPPRTDSPEGARPYFRALRELRDGLRANGLDVPELSMGMSADARVAVEEGATYIRVGTALFGPRQG